MPRIAALKVVALCLMLSACVTINVYFPEAAAEKAADQFMDGVGWPGADQPAPKKQSAVREQQSPSVLLAATAGLLEWLIAPAQAQSADINIETPAIRQIQKSMTARLEQLRKHYESGAIGLTRDGLVEIRDQNPIPLAERYAVRKLVAEENADRANLYREIAVANGNPDWEPQIRATFAERWIERAAAGWYVQDEKGGWQRK